MTERKELARFNEETTDGRVIASKGTTWSDPMPLVDIDGTRIGNVTNIALEGNRLMGDIEFDLDSVFSLTIDMANFSVEREDPVLRISGDVRSARVSPDSSYPWKD